MITVLFRAVLAALSVLRLPVWLLRRAFAAPKGAWVHLVLDGPLRERIAPRPWFLGPKKGTALPAVRKLAKAVAGDPRVAGVLVTVKSPGGAVDRHALLEALEPVRAAKKPVVAHLPAGGGSPHLHLASVADRVLVSKGATLGPLGAAATVVHARTFLDRLGLVPEVVAAGRYKSAGDMVSKDALSEPNREQLDRMLDVGHAEVRDRLATSRRKAADEVDAFFDRGLASPEEAREQGMIDEVVHDDEVTSALGPERATVPARTIPAPAYLARRTAPLFASFLPRPGVVVVPIEGPIVESGVDGGVASSERLVPLFDALRDSPWVRAVVLAIDSPGGGVLASEKIHRAVSRLAEKKPVVARMGNVAASGGYYIAVAAHEIVASPLTITGSIGVIAARFSAGPLFARLGVAVETLRRGARADLLLPARAMEADERAALQAEIERSYERFLEVVAAGRKRDKEQIRPLAEGRVWMGVDALEHGLVDHLGSLDDALARARTLAGLADDAPERWVTPRPRVRLSDLLGGRASAAMSAVHDAAETLLSLEHERVLALSPEAWASAALPARPSGLA